MDKSILLEQRNQIFSILMTIVCGINGVMILIDDRISLFRDALGVSMLLLCLFYGFHSVLGYSVTSKYAAKIRVTDNLIELRTKFGLVGTTLKLNWQDIKEIQFDSYSIHFKLSDGTKSVRYQTSSERSRQLKQLLRETAEQRNIQISGG